MEQLKEVSMSMTDTEAPAAVNKPKPKQKKKPGKTARRASFAKPAEKDVTFPGLTESKCATACSAAKCVISGSGICGHPRKGGLQVQDNGAQQRLQQAQKQLGIEKVERRFA